MTDFDFTSPGAFRYFLSIDGRSRILSTDSANGASCVSLAAHSDFVVCMCESLEASYTMKNLLRRLSLKNVHIVICELSKPVFKDETFTHICLHDYQMEQAGNAGNNSSPLVALMASLTESGEFYICRAYMNGESWFSRIFSKEPYTVPAQLKRYADIEHYETLSSPWFIRFIRHSAYRSFKYKLRGDNTGTIYVKRKNNGTDSYRLIDRLKESIESRVGAGIGTCDLLRIGSGSSLVADFESLIARIPQSKNAIARCQRNYSALAKLSTLSMPVPVPRPLCDEWLGDNYVTAETKLDGVSLDNYRNLADRDELAVFNDAREFLLTERCVVGIMDENLFNKLVAEPLQQIAYKTEKSHRDLFTRIASMARNSLLQDEVPVVIEHGDFKYSNFLIHRAGPKLVGIVDWDRSSIPGLPLRDYMSLLSCRKHQSIPASIDYMISCATLASPDSIHRVYAEKFGLSDRVFGLLSFLAAIRTILDFDDPSACIAPEHFEEKILEAALQLLRRNTR